MEVKQIVIEKDEFIMLCQSGAQQADLECYKLSIPILSQPPSISQKNWIEIL